MFHDEFQKSAKGSLFFWNMYWKVMILGIWW